MPKESFGRGHTGRVLPLSAEATSSGSSLVEEIWSSWRREKVAATAVGTPGKLTREALPASHNPGSGRANAAERFNQLKRRGEYEQALELALSEIKREEEEGRSHASERPSVPWYYWQAASIYRQLKRYSEEIALIRRFAKNHDIHFRAFSKRYRSTRGTTYAWATKFLERIDAAKAAAAAREDEQDRGRGDNS